jgi:GNAT superfamily N-acetyltransferase
MQFKIVQARVDFSNEIAKLTSELGYEVSDDETKKWLSTLINSPFHSVLVALTEKYVCGWLVVEKRLFLESGFTAEITGLVVGSQFRRHGIADSLVTVAEKWAREEHLDRVVVRSNAKRIESHAFYPSVGYKHSKISHVYVKQIGQIT